MLRPLVLGFFAAIVGVTAAFAGIATQPATQPATASQPAATSPAVMNPGLVAMMNKLTSPSSQGKKTDVASGILHEGAKVVGTIMKPRAIAAAMHPANNSARIDAGRGEIWGHDCAIIVYAEKLKEDGPIYSPGKQIGVQGVATSWQMEFSEKLSPQYLVVIRIPESHLLYCRD